jgi:cyclin T
MQRFYMFHSFTRFHRNAIAAASLFLAAKVTFHGFEPVFRIRIHRIRIHRVMDPDPDPFLIKQK